MPIPAMTELPTVERPQLRDVVFTRLRTAIMDGTMVPGEALAEREVETWFGVARTPVREAIRDLERAGLVEAVASRQTWVVSTPGPSDALGALHALGVVYAGSVRLALSALPTPTIRYAAGALESLTLTLSERHMRDASVVMFDVFETLVAEAGEPQLDRLRRNAVFGLFFKVRAAEFTATQYETMSRAARELRDGLLALDITVVRRSMEDLFLFPATDAEAVRR